MSITELAIIEKAINFITEGKDESALWCLTSLISVKPAQRQDSLSDQMDDLLDIGTKLGLYDAVDFIKRKA